jgi:hypothetical protein
MKVTLILILVKYWRYMMNFDIFDSSENLARLPQFPRDLDNKTTSASRQEANSPVNTFVSIVPLIFAKGR